MENTYNNRLVCRHGSLERKCDICDLEKQLTALEKKYEDLKDKARTYYICAADVISGDPCIETINRYGHSEEELCEALGITKFAYDNNKDKP
jgi:hypothetical protein